MVTGSQRYRVATRSVLYSDDAPRGSEAALASTAVGGCHRAPRRSCVLDVVAAAHGLACLGLALVSKLTRPRLLACLRWARRSLGQPWLWPAASVSERSVQEQEREQEQEVRLD